MSRKPNITYRIMSSIKSSNTKPEIALRKELWNRGLRFRKNYTKLIGKPDIVFTRAKLAIFCDGDFWHGHNWKIRGYENFYQELNTYSDYWAGKLIKNVIRDASITMKLEKAGWTVLRIWESEIKEDKQACADLVEYIYRGLLT